MRNSNIISRPAATLALSACTFLGLLASRAHAQTFDTVLNTNLFQPASVAISSQNHYIISDTADHRIIDFNADNRNFVVLAGPDIAPFEAGAVDGQRIDARFRNPQGVLCIGDKTYVADSGNHVIREIDSLGNVRTIAGDLAAAHEVDDYGGLPSNWGFADGIGASAKFSAPCGLAWDGQGHIYIADSGNKAVRILDLNSGTVTTAVRSGLASPVAVALSPSGTLFISDAGAHSIKIWRPGDTRATLVAGGGNALARGFRNSSIATNALFNAPGGIYYREISDELIVADSGNGVLRTVQNISKASPKVDTFANTSSAGFSTPIAVTRDLYGVFLVCDSTRNTLASVITVKFPRIDKPQVGYIQVVVDRDTGEPVARLIPVTDSTFDNLVRIAVSGDVTGQHRFVAIPSVTDLDEIPLPTTNSTPAVNFAQPIEPAPPDDVLNNLSINPLLPPRFNFHLKVFTAPRGIDERIPSLVQEAVFRFKCGTPQLDSQSIPGRLVFRCNTTNAVMYYTLDGSEPKKNNGTSKQIKNFDSIPLILTTNTVVVRARAYKDDTFIASDISQAEFSPENFVPNRISIGFEDGEASTLMRAAPGQRYFAPVTLSLMPGAQAYGLQFDLSLEPQTGPASADYHLGFNSTLVETFPTTNRVIPPATFVLAGTNYVTNTVFEITTNFTYQVSLTNYSASPTTNFLTFTNKLQDLVPIVTSSFITNLGQSFPITSTNYVTNSFQLAGTDSITNVTTDIETNFLYRYTAPGVTNVVRVDSKLPELSPIVVTNFIANLGQLFSFNTTNYVTNSFNLVSSGTVTNTTVTTDLSYAYQAVTPALTNFVSLSGKVPENSQVIVTNFVTNLGQLFPVTVTNTLTNAFDLVSSVFFTNAATTVGTNYAYRAVSPGATTELSWNGLLADRTPVIVTNFLTNLGQLFPVVTTNYISNAFNLVSASIITNRTLDIRTNFLYEAATPAQTNIVLLDHPLADSTEIITTNLVPNLGQSFSSLTTNRITNSFNLASASYRTNVTREVSGNYLYEVATPARTNVIEVDHQLVDRSPVVTSNFIANLGELFPVFSTNYISNNFDLFSLDVVTNTTRTVSTNFDYRATVPGFTNYITATSRLADRLPVVLTNFVANLGQLFPVVSTNYISNAFNLISISVETNRTLGITTNYLYETSTPGLTNVVVLDHLLVDKTEVLTTNFIPNLGSQFPVVTTNYLSNSFNLFSADIVTNVQSIVTTNFAYRSVSPGQTNLITVNNLLPDEIPVIVTNFVNNLGQQFPVVTTNFVTNAFDLLSSIVTTNSVSDISTAFVYRAISRGASNYVTLDHYLPDLGPVVTSTVIPNQGLFYPMTSTNLVQNTLQLVSANTSTNIANTITTTYLYDYASFFVTNQLVWPGPLPDTSEIFINSVLIGSGSVPLLDNSQLIAARELKQVQVDGGEVDYYYELTYQVPGGILKSGSPLSFSSPNTLRSTGYVTNASTSFSFLADAVVPNTVFSTNTFSTTNVVKTISTNVVYRSLTPAVTNYVTLSTNLPDVIPVIISSTITNLGKTYSATSTNLATNVFELVSATYTTNIQTVVTTNATYALRSPAVTNVINLSTNLPDAAPVVSTFFVTNLGQLFPVKTTNFVANTFEFLGAQFSTNVQTTVSTNATYIFVQPSVDNYVLWPDLLPAQQTVLTTNFIVNLGRPFPVVVTNYLTNAFRLVGSIVSTNTSDGVSTNAVYAFSSATITNLLTLTNKLPDSAPVVTTTFLTNLGQLFPIQTTNFVANGFEFLGERHSTNTQTSARTNVTYIFIDPAVTNYVWWPELLPPAAAVVTTNLVNNLGRQFPVAQTNYVTNAFRLVGSDLSTNDVATVSTNIVYEFRTGGVTNYLSLLARLPDVAPVITTNFVSNLGQLFPIVVTNYLTNTFRLVNATLFTNDTTTFVTNAVYDFSVGGTTNYLNLAAKLPPSREVITTNFISNLGQFYPVTATNLVQNTFELLATNVFTNTTFTVSTNVLYALKSPGVTNLVFWPVKLPDSVTVVSTNFITNLGSFFPVLSTNVVANQFQFLYTNYNTNIAYSVQTNIYYEFHTPAVTNLFSLDERLPAFVEVISTNFVTNLGRLFPVRTTNLTENIFDLISSDVITNETVDISTSYRYQVVSPGTTPNTPVSITTNFMTLDQALPQIVPIINVVGFVTNVSQVFTVYSTNYVTNTFKLVGTTVFTNTSRVSATNVSDVFASLILDNPAQNWLAVGWIERYGQTNLYNTKLQDLISFSQPHDTVFNKIGGGTVAGAFSFVVPTNAATGDKYTVRVARPSATADGVGQDMFIQAPDDRDVKSPVKAIRTLIVTNELHYLAGDVSDFLWYNAGEFGDGSILNNDLTELQQAIIYGLNLPPMDSDFMDAMDTCCVTEDGRDLSSMQYASDPTIDLNEIAFGEGSRYAPLGSRPFARLEINDLFLTFRRSLDPDMVWYQRYWSNGSRHSRVVPNTFRGEASASLRRQSTVSAMSLPSAPSIQSDQAPALTVYAGVATGMPGTVVAVPVHARVDGGFPLRTLMFNARVETADGAIVNGFSIEAAATDALGAPTPGWLLNGDPGRSGVAWLDTSVAGVLGDKVVARVLFTIPPGAQPSSLYYVKIDRVSGSPNGISLFPARSGSGLVAMANRPTPVWNDGIPDSWRMQYFGTLNDPRSAAEVDADGDGLSNFEEYKLGTNPIDATDNLRVHAAANGRGVKIRFRTVSGKMYRIEGSTNLEPGSWTTVQTDVAGTGNDLELPAPGGAHSFYYRVRLQD